MDQTDVNSLNRKSKILILHSAGYPCAIDRAPFVAREIDALIAAFDRVIIVPISTFVEKDLKVPKGAEIVILPAKMYASPVGKVFLFVLGCLYSPLLISDINAAKDLGSKVRVKPNVRSHMRSYIVIGYDLVLAYCLKQRLPANCRAISYHFWLFAHGYVADKILRNSGRVGAMVARAHSQDLFSEKRLNILALMRYPYLKALDKIWSVSDAGTEYLVNDVGLPSSKCETLLLGSVDFGVLDAKPESDEILSIVSCSYVTEHKRVDMVGRVCQALAARPDIRGVKWTHIGDGPDWDQLKERFKSDGDKFTVNWVGRVKPTEVREQIVNSRPHLFLHLALFEGLPIAIVEALSMGLPCVATAAGGTAEIIDDSVGKLLQTEDSDQMAINAVVEVFERIKAGGANDYKTAARNRFLSGLSLSATLPQLVDELYEAGGEYDKHH